MAIYHLLPVDDIQTHEESNTCPCNPSLKMGDNGDMLFIHNAFDGREEKETPPPSPLIIPGILPDLNKELNLAKGHWSKYSKTKKSNNHYISALSKQYKHKHPNPYPIPNRLHICLNWFVKDKRKDPDNIYFAVKYVLDGMVEGGLLGGDGFKHIASITHNIQIDKEEPRVEVSWVDAEKYQTTYKLIF